LCSVKGSSTNYQLEDPFLYVSGHPVYSVNRLYYQRENWALTVHLLLVIISKSEILNLLNEQLEGMTYTSIPPSTK